MRQRGFTLVELALVVAGIGIVLSISTPLIQYIRRSQVQSNYINNTIAHQKIAESLLAATARTNELATLPAPNSKFTVDEATSTVNDMVVSYAGGIGLTPMDLFMNDKKQARFYLTVPSQQTQMRSDSIYGLLANVTFDRGAVWTSPCRVLSYSSTAATSIEDSGTADCTNNPNNASDLSAKFGSGQSSQPLRFGIITDTLKDASLGKPAFFSNLALQEKKFKQFEAQIVEIRSRITAYIQTARINASASSLSYTQSLAPVPSGASPSDPLATGGYSCQSSWVSLYTVDILPVSLGLDNANYGRTPWGGHILYCANYGTDATNAAIAYYLSVNGSDASTMFTSNHSAILGSGSVVVIRLGA